MEVADRGDTDAAVVPHQHGRSIMTSALQGAVPPRTGEARDGSAREEAPRRAAQVQLRSFRQRRLRQMRCVRGRHPHVGARLLGTLAKLSPFAWQPSIFKMPAAFFANAVVVTEGSPVARE